MWKVGRSITSRSDRTEGASLLVDGNAKFVNNGTFFDGDTYNGFELAAQMATFSSTAGEITRIQQADQDLGKAGFLA